MLFLTCQLSPVPSLNMPLGPLGLCYHPGSAMIKVQTSPPLLDLQLLPLPNLSSAYHYLIVTPSLPIPACLSDLRCGIAVLLRMPLWQPWKSAPAKQPAFNPLHSLLILAYITGIRMDHNYQLSPGPCQ